MFGFYPFEISYDPFMVGEVLAFLGVIYYGRPKKNSKTSTLKHLAPLRGKARAPT
jgi:hypothetical protein